MSRIAIGTLILLIPIGAAIAKDIDRVFWGRAFTELCLQESYARPEVMRELALAGRTAQSVCQCGGDVMATTFSVPLRRESSAPVRRTLAWSCQIRPARSAPASALRSPSTEVNPRAWLLHWVM